MPRECPECDITFPDAVNVGGGVRGVKYCINCGGEVE